MNHYDKAIKNLNYVLLLTLFISLIFSIIVTTLSIYNNKVNSFNTWQFPMLLALFGDQLFFLFYK